MSTQGIEAGSSLIDSDHQFLSDAAVGTAVALKPSSQNTLHRLQVSLLSVLPNFPRPSGVTLEWLAEHSLDSVRRPSLLATQQPSNPFNSSLVLLPRTTCERPATSNFSALSTA